jgi:uncharacterized protein
MIRAIAMSAGLGVLWAALASGCSSPPSQLYVLSSQPATSTAAQARSDVAAGSGSSRPKGASRPDAAPVVAVTVTVPDYADRSNMVERTGANQLKPIYTAQWAENLGVTATRAVSENLTSLLPSDDVVMLPSRSRRSFDYQVNLDLTRFESDPQGVATLAGRWSISDTAGTERASGRVYRTEAASEEGYAGMAEAMSRNLAAASEDIATALRRVTAEAAASSGAPPARSPTGRARR